MEYEEVEVNSERWFDLRPLLNEEFRDIKGYNNKYQISNYGRVKSLFFKNNKYTIKREKILKNINRDNKKNSYMIINLRKNNYKFYYIHRLVARAFLKKKKYQDQINHKDGNKQNNRVDNLEWCNESENQLHSIRMGLKKPAKGLQCANTREVAQYTKDMIFIKKWDYIAMASKELNIVPSNITRCCKKQIPSAGGYVWHYIEEE